MERYDCSLWDFLKNETKYLITPEERYDITVEIIEVVIFLQSNKICHRDLKPSNILLRTKKLPNGQEEILLNQWVLTDFGLASRMANLSGSNGTPGFASMEQFVGKSHEKSDNYSISKLAVLILFKWNVAWNLLARPIPVTDNFSYLQFEIITTLSELLTVIS